MRLIDVGTAAETTDQWKELARRIAEMPHMRYVATPASPAPARRPSTSLLVEALGRSLPAAPSWRTAAFAAACVIAAFAAGYLFGLSRP